MYFWRILSSGRGDVSNLTFTLELKCLTKSNGIIFKMDAVRFSETSAGPTRWQNLEDYHLNIIRSKGLIGYIQQKCISFTS